MISLNALHLQQNCQGLCSFAQTTVKQYLSSSFFNEKKITLSLLWELIKKKTLYMLTSNNPLYCYCQKDGFKLMFFLELLQDVKIWKCRMFHFKITLDKFHCLLQPDSSAGIFSFNKKWHHLVCTLTTLTITSIIMQAARAQLVPLCSLEF